MTPAGSSASDLNLGAIIFAGGMAGVAMWSIAIPPDVCCILLVIRKSPYLTTASGYQITASKCS